MNRHVWLLLSGSLWAVMMFFLFQQEIRPYFEYQAPPSYRQSVGRWKNYEPYLADLFAALPLR